MSKKVGSKAEVWHGTAEHTAGKLYKADLMQNKHGRIVSKKKHELGQKNIEVLQQFQKTAEELDAIRPKKNKSKQV